MKKSIIFTGILIACLCSAAVTVSAKDGKEKKDVKEYLPEAGDFAISVSANPFINFVGNIFNNTANQAIGTFCSVHSRKIYADRRTRTPGEPRMDS